jgi:hypothetical protein
MGVNAAKHIREHYSVPVTIAQLREALNEAFARTAPTTSTI